MVFLLSGVEWANHGHAGPLGQRTKTRFHMRVTHMRFLQGRLAAGMASVLQGIGVKC
jgi:hypothetical protein